MSDTKLPLVDHIYLTYRSLRGALVITCFLIPIGLIVVGFITGIGIQESLSDYYYAEFPPMLLRALFVGLLFLLGGLLIAYRGFSLLDNWIHNLAGVSAWGVAIFPMKCPHVELPYSELCYLLISSNMHYVSALLLFAFSIVSIIYNGGQVFRDLYKDLIPDKIGSFVFWRWISGIIVGGGVIYALLMLIMGGRELLVTIVWIPESMGFIGFGIYWGTVTYYIFVANSRAEKQEKQEKKKKQVSVAPEEELGRQPTRAIP